MRHIGQLPDETQSRVFGDFLVGCGVPNEIERENDGSWTVWIIHEEHLAAAQGWFARFKENPNAEEFRKSRAEADRQRKAQAEELAAYHRRIRTRRSLFAQYGGYGIGVLTYTLIVACVAVAFVTKLGGNQEVTQYLLINQPGSQAFLEQVRAGQIWRLFTPLLLHFGIAHIVFNMLALYYLGCMVEGRCSTRLLALLVVVIGLSSNLAQYTLDGPKFGGMSGVVYGLVGYVWMRGKYDRGSGLFLDRTNLIIALVWLVACYSGLLGPIANTAHTVGLVLGILWGRLAAYRKAQRPE